MAFAKLILKRPAYLGRDNQPDLFENKPALLFFLHCFPFLSTAFLLIPLPLSICFLSSFSSLRPTCMSLAAQSANRDRHCLSTHPTEETAFPFLLEYWYKFIGGCLCWAKAFARKQVCFEWRQTVVFFPARACHQSRRHRWLRCCSVCSYITRMVGISVQSTLAASWLICKGCIKCVSSVSRDWRAIFPLQRPWNRICHLPFRVYNSLILCANEDWAWVYVCKGESERLGGRKC